MSLLVLGKFKRFKKLLLPLKSSENRRFSREIKVSQIKIRSELVKGNRSYRR